MYAIRPLLRLPSKLRRRARRARLATMLLLLLVFIALLTPFYIVYKPPNSLIRYFQRRWPDVIWHVPTKMKLVALTIDDAPSEHSEEIRRVLEANGASATFFVIGAHVPGREVVLQDLVRSGNELANHAMHDEPSRSLSDAVLVAQITSVETKLRDAYAAVGGGQEPPKYFRPGSGFFSARMRRLLRELGYRLVLGSIYPHDAQISFWQINAAHVLSMVRPGGIIVCHDRGWTVQMLRTVLPELERRGYRVVSVGELLRETGRV